MRAIKPVEPTRGLAVLVYTVGIVGLILDSWPLLYILFGVNQIVRIGASLWNSRAHLAAHPAILQPPENMRDYLAYGILALFSIHVMSALRAVNARRRRARQTNPARSSGAGEVAPPWQRVAAQNQR